MSLRACAARPAHRAALSVSSICSTSEVSISVTENIRISCYNGQRSQACEIIYNVYNYMQEHYPGMSGKQLRLKVADACGKSSSTVYRVLKESENSPGETKKFTTPHKRRPRKKEKSDFDDFNKCLLRRVINEFHVTEEESPTLKGILRAVKERIQYQGSVSSLRKIILDVGFKWKRAENNLKLLVENSSAVSKTWTESETKGLKNPISKGKRGVQCLDTRISPMSAVVLVAAGRTCRSAPLTHPAPPISSNSTPLHARTVSQTIYKGNDYRKPAVVGITSLGLDHTSLLGNTIEEIAWQKGGIMKLGTPAFTSPQLTPALEVLNQRAVEKKCPLWEVPPLSEYDCDGLQLSIGLKGDVQTINTSLALQLSRAWINRQQQAKSSTGLLGYAKAFRIDGATAEGIKSCSWPGRYQVLTRKSDHGSCTYYLDGAHTLESVELCVQWFRQIINKDQNRSSCRYILVFNVTGDRKPTDLLVPLMSCQFDSAFFCPNISVSDPKSNVKKVKVIKTAHDYSSMRTEHKYFDTKVAAAPPTSTSLKNSVIPQQRQLIVQPADYVKQADVHKLLLALSVPAIALLCWIIGSIDEVKYDLTNYTVTSKHQLDRCEDNKNTWLSLTKDDSSFTTELETFPSVTETLKYIEGRKGEQRVLVTGSLHLVGAVLSAFDLS
ncbi:hypothetical protein J6590_012189 [Homalodisca vitripennis]|nr:hypothetical protein J6590_012189 [Homalodisca vitripennis]